MCKFKEAAVCKTHCKQEADPSEGTPKEPFVQDVGHLAQASYGASRYSAALDSGVLDPVPMMCCSASASVCMQAQRAQFPTLPTLK